MKLIRFGTAGKEKPGVIINEKRYDVSSIVSDYNESFFENDGLETLKKALQSNHPSCYVLLHAQTNHSRNSLRLQ